MNHPETFSSACHYIFANKDRPPVIFKFATQKVLSVLRALPTYPNFRWYMWETVDDLSFEATVGNCSIDSMTGTKW